MCGRYTVTSPIEVIADLFQLPLEASAAEADPLPELRTRFNLAPTQEAPVVRVLTPGAPRQLDLLRWGLIPYWAKEASIGNRMINARAESAAEKPAYRWAFKKHRCLVVTDGFYEWKKVAGGKQPYYIRRKDRQPFAFAGLWSRWQPPDGALPVESYTILTTDANAKVSELHDRMPVILDRESFGLWLDPGMQDVERLKPLLVPMAGDELETVPVSKRVNSPAYDGAECVEPLIEHGVG
jgi:putative SOS response-associated peptidase YedK